jgi:hypothetical protein
MNTIGIFCIPAAYPSTLNNRVIFKLAPLVQNLLVRFSLMLFSECQ